MLLFDAELVLVLTLVDVLLGDSVFFEFIVESLGRLRLDMSLESGEFLALKAPVQLNRK